MKKKKHLLELLVIIICMLSVSYLKVQYTWREGHTQATVVIDAGHGGFDPGKVAADGSMEKDINLSIACKLRMYLEKQGVHVVMTRTEDAALGSWGNKSNKNADMQARIDTINTAGAVCGISIHQNSFTNANVRGAQVFYYQGATEAEKLALQIQESIKVVLQDSNTRQPKENTSYYILRKAICPMVIVECGFLSHPEESLLLQEESYQNKLAEGMGKGILSALRTFEN